MYLITPEIKNFLNQQNLGYVATVSPSGMPNISPKGTIIGWDSETLAFVNIRSPDTIDNLKNNSSVEINVIDPILRKGYMFLGLSLHNIVLYYEFRLCLDITQGLNIIFHQHSNTFVLDSKQDNLLDQCNMY